ncbi:MAG: DNA mismatch repair endonuclease MutL [Lachnospiraceae bacterium]|nr:DNA mismatch repair endonuclease MutL [Lachnospiraceae bacterium]
MADIELLNEETIDKIAAGEVVERPASIVKELVENAIDAGATSITVEIKDGGIAFIRVTDNGEGIKKDQIKKAFFRHATSKLRSVSDLETLRSLGFRGEALSSIAAVSQVELMTKTKDELIGNRYVIEGAVEKEFSEIGLPPGTTVIIRNVFFNTPARRKFLKSSVTEAGYISDICEHLALSRPDIAFKFVNAGLMRFNTTGDGDLKEVIYRIYGKDVAKELIPISRQMRGIEMNGFLGKPVLNRSNRNFEKFFVNNRYIKSSLLSTAAELGYKQYLMQHKFPFFVLNIDIDTTALDVNVHPTKMEIKFNNDELISDFIESGIEAVLKVNEMIPDVLLEIEKSAEVQRSKEKGPEPYELNRRSVEPQTDEVIERPAVFEVDFEKGTVNESIPYSKDEPVKKEENTVPDRVRLFGNTKEEKESATSNVIKAHDVVYASNPIQMNFFEEKLLSREAMEEYEIIGQVFDTYWMFSYKDNLLIMDQHAAHEKVKYEAILKKMKNEIPDKQELNPPMIISLSGNEKSTLERYKESFEAIGYEYEEFGGGEIAVRAVPLDLYGLNEREVFMEVLDELAMVSTARAVPDVFNNRIATMACKAAVKGNTSMTKEEVLALLKQLMTLDNPYNCPHGRPTIINMSKYELDKKFKRIV